MTTSTRGSARDAAALIDQLFAVQTWLSGLTDAELAQDSTQPGRRVRDLYDHLQHVINQFADQLVVTDRRRTSGRQMPATTLLPQVWSQLQPTEGDGRPDGDPPAELTSAIRRLESALTSDALPPTVAVPEGKAKIADLIRVHLVWAVIRADDLSRSVPLRDPIPTPRKPLSIACRMVADVLAEQHPGQSVEVRVPPFAAVQCGTGAEGPTHTRGTPPNVVETEPSTFLRLATARLAWNAAVADGLVSASGQRADLSAVLPVLD